MGCGFKLAQDVFDSSFDYILRKGRTTDKAFDFFFLHILTSRKDVCLHCCGFICFALTSTEEFLGIIILLLLHRGEQSVLQPQVKMSGFFPEAAIFCKG